jgi:hypothetical protein
MNEELDDQPLTLEEAFKFTWEDLAENRQGRLSEAQKQRLRRFPLRFLFGFLFMFGFGALFYLVAIVSRGGRGLTPEFVIFLFGTIFVVMIPLMIIQWWRLLSDIRDGTVMTLRGTAKIKQRQIGRNNIAYVEIDGAGQNLDLWVEAFEDGENYVVYYTPRLKRVVAAEKID